MTEPEVVVLDVNETLSDLEPLRTRLTDAGAPAHLLETWFAATLRDGFALTVTGDCAPFRAVGTDVLTQLLSTQQGLRGEARSLAEHVLDGFAELDLHSDVAEGMRLLHASGRRLVTLTNGAVAASRALLERGGVSDLVDRQLSVEDAGHWKPHPRAYAWAAEQCGTPPGAMLMVAVHPWDLHGAARAGMTTGWVDRKGSSYPAVLGRPTWQAADLPRLAALVAAQR
ncbi:MAG: haloacid dehalogenase type II [Nocardioidaceae bacterium]